MYRNKTRLANRSRGLLRWLPVPLPNVPITGTVAKRDWPIEAVAFELLPASVYWYSRSTLQLTKQPVRLLGQDQVARRTLSTSTESGFNGEKYAWDGRVWPRYVLGPSLGLELSGPHGSPYEGPALEPQS